MIQRIQTVYMLLALVCLTIFYFVPFGSLFIGSEVDLCSYPINVFGVDVQMAEGLEHFSVIPLLVLISITALAVLVTIFLFKHRIAQIRLCAFSMIMSLGCTGLSFFYLYKIADKFGGDYSVTILIVLPIIACILLYLAMRAVARDEALVKSIDRIR